MNTIIIKHFHKLTPETRAEYEYENVLQSYYTLNFDEAKTKINNWEINKQLPYHEVKRAGLLAEFGMLEEAINILEESLSVIRRNSLLSSKDNDYSSASQEAYVIFMLRMFKRSWSLPDNGKDLSKKYRSRLAHLSQYRCDPDNEFKYLEIRLESNLEDDSSKLNSDFDLGKRTKTTHFGIGSTDNGALYAFNFLLLAESIGLPFHIPDCTIFGKTAGNAARSIYNHCPHWSTFTVLRVFNEKYFETILNRNNLSTMGRVKAESQFDKYLSKYESIVSKQLSDKLDNALDIESSMLKVVPEILSRLVTKVSFDKKWKVISLLCRMYNLKEFTGYDYTKKLLTRTINNLSLEQKIQLIPTFIDFPSQPLSVHGKHFQRFNFINPFTLIVNITNQLNHTSFLTNDKKIPSTKIKQNLFEITNGDDDTRRISAIKLIILHKLGLLNKLDEKRLVKALWSKQDEFGFPTDSGYYSYFFINELRPEEEDIQKKILHLIKQFSFPKQDGNSVTLTGGQSHYCNELIGSLSNMSFTEDDIQLIISKISNWYYSDRDWLNKKDDMLDEFLQRFKNIAFILTVILKKHNHLVREKAEEEITSLLLDMKSKGVPVGRAITILSLNKKTPLEAIISNIKEEFHQLDETSVIDAIESLYILLNENVDLTQALLLISQKISWNRGPCVQESLEFALDAIKKKNLPLSSGFVDEIILGLNNILKSDKSIEASNEPFLSHLEKKVSSAKLASYLYNKYMASELNVPVTLLEWKDVCTSSDEFEEIRNAWLYKEI